MSFMREEGGGVFGAVLRATSPTSGNPLGEMKPATHESMLSSRRWPADEARTLQGGNFGTPTKRADYASAGSDQPGPGGKNEILGLDMSNSRIAVLTPTIARFSFLTELRLGNNQLKGLPVGISLLRALAFLDLSNNQLAELRSEVGWMTGLKELLVFNNNLVDFPPELGYLYQLENFGIDGNPLNENLAQISHNQGPLAIIPFLRDHVISMAAPWAAALRVQRLTTDRVPC